MIVFLRGLLHFIMHKSSWQFQFTKDSAVRSSYFIFCLFASKLNLVIKISVIEFPIEIINSTKPPYNSV